MKRLLHPGVIAFLVFTASTTVFAQELERSDPADTSKATENKSKNPAIRLEYGGTPDMPDGIALYILTTVLNGVAESDFDTAVGLARTATEVDEATAISLVNYLLDLGSRLETERVASEKMIACSSERGVRTIEENYHVLSLLDDVRLSVYSKYFAIAGSELDLEQYRLLKKWLDLTKISSNYARLNYDYLYQNRKSDADVKDSIDQFCNIGEY